jgi:Type I phosphodiesterase / nucleotide pyrophosphatase
MTDELTIPPTLPSYGEGTLADLASSLLGSLGMSGEPNPLRLPETTRACLLVVDGLGWELLRDHPAAAPFLSELAVSGRALAAGFPATTVTSLASLGTGRPPGVHGMLGYQVAVPGTGRLLNGLRWDSRVDPAVWQPVPTVYERAEAAGISAFRVAASAFQKSGLTLATSRGATYRPADSLGALVQQAGIALRAAEPAFVTVYVGDLDSTGHVFGSGSDAWYYELGHVDKLAEQLASVLPTGTLLYVTADHGMVDISPGSRVDVDDTPELREGVSLLGGEPRARHVYAQPGAAKDVLAAWQDALGERAWVVSRDQAVADGWFGPVEPAMTARIGDVVAAAAGTNAIVATQAEPRESALSGMHGSLTSAEQLVPLLAHSAL